MTIANNIGSISNSLSQSEITESARQLHINILTDSQVYLLTY